MPRLVRRSAAHRLVERPVPRAVGAAACRRVGPGACRAVARRGVPVQRSPAGPAAQERPQQEECRQQAGFCQAEAVAVRPGHRAHASAVAVPGRVAAIPERPFPAARAAAKVRRVFPAASARSAEAGVARHGAAAAEAAQHEAVPRPEERAAEAEPSAAVGLLPGVAEAEPGAAAEPLPGVAAAAPGVAAGPQPEAVAGAERDGAERLPVAEPGAAELPQAVLPSGPPSASVCRRGRLRPRALPLAPRPVARSARGRRSLPSAAPKWRWWQATQDEG